MSIASKLQSTNDLLRSDPSTLHNLTCRLQYGNVIKQERAAISFAERRSVRHDPLEHGGRSRSTFVAQSGGGSGDPVWNLLVSALRVCATAWTFGRRRPGSDTGVLRSSIRQTNTAIRRPRAWSLSVVFVGVAEELPGQAKASRRRAKAGRRTIGDLAGFRRRREPLPA